ncbi:MAG TPA: PadR family transcriptional regulator [Dehalococcoidia bacterium]|nr:PadR family transcriptional regulator [Dehalococcoidia bacterium]
MSLDHAILGFVNERARSGYDLKKAFDATVAHIWPAKQSQIYLTLARLNKAGLVELRVVQQDGKPNRKVYHITEAGLDELRRWLACPLPLTPVRDAFLVQMTWADSIETHEIAGLIDAWEIAHRKRLAECRWFLYKLEQNPPKGRWGRVLIPLAVEQLIMAEETSLRWAAAAKNSVKAMPSPEGDAGRQAKNET